MQRKLAVLVVVFAGFVVPAMATGVGKPLAARGGGAARSYDKACITHGNTCDPRYVPPGSVCCPPYHCQYLYPNVPLFCV
jgi:hypothetical protein